MQIISSGRYLANGIRVISPEQAETIYGRVHRRIRQLTLLKSTYSPYKFPNYVVDGLMDRLLETDYGTPDFVSLFLLFQKVDVLVDDYCKKLEAL